jgi:exosortase/archaeosortase family protein
VNLRRDADGARLVLALCAAAAGIMLVDTSPALQAVLEPLAVWFAGLAAELIRLSGLAVAHSADVLRHPGGFGFRIDYGCTAIRPAIGLVAVLAALPLAVARRCLGMLAGLAAIAVLNLCRLLHLYWLGVHQPEHVAFAHEIVWNIVTVAALLAYLAYWMRRTPEPSCASSR